MRDIEVIKQFYLLISWQNMCQEIEYGDRTLLKTEKTIKLPSFYENYQESLDFAVKLASEFSLRPYLILWGDAPQEMVERIWWESKRKTPRVHITWIPPYFDQMLWCDDMTLKALEGIDWDKSLQNVLTGDKKPVWSWENERKS